MRLPQNFDPPLTPSSPKHSALGMATLIPLTANLEGWIEQPSIELEYSYGEEK